MSYIVNKDTWFIAHNNVDVFHYGFAEIGKALDTGQPILEEFDNEVDWLDRLSELNISTEDDN